VKRTIKIGKTMRDVSSDDKYLANMGGEFEPDMTRLFETLIKPDMVVADIGANIGMTALLFSDLAKNVYAFEPGRSIFDILSGNLSGVDNVELVNIGMGDVCSDQVLTFMKANRSGGWVGDEIKLENKDYMTETIRIETLDHFFDGSRPAPDFIKMDVEGFEPSVLRGAHTLLARDKPTVVLELNHFCLNVVHRVTLPDFMDQLRALFPVLLAVDNGNKRLANLHDPDAAYMVMHDHATKFNFPNIVAGFSDDLHGQMQALAAQASLGA
jgi:FkbM family methyltransferase